MTRVVGIPLVIALVACAPPVPERVEIAPYRLPCGSPEEPRMCLLTGREGSAFWTIEPEPILGFDHQWGHTYVIERLLVSRSSDREGGPLGWYDLVKVHRDDVVADRTEFAFMISVPPSDRQPMFEWTETGEGRFVGGPSFSCEDAATCSSLRDVAEQDVDLVLVFEFRVDTEIRLVLTIVEVFPGE